MKATREGDFARRNALDRERFLAELHHFHRYFVGRLGMEQPAGGDEAILQSFYDNLADECDRLPRVYCHRDFQSRNLMVRDGRLALIDFQDARRGPYTYDAASLLRDSSLDLEEDLVDEMLARLGERLSLPGEEFRRDFDLTALQRNIKDAQHQGSRHLRLSGNGARPARLPRLRAPHHPLHPQRTAAGSPVRYAVRRSRAFSSPLPRLRERRVMPFVRTDRQPLSARRFVLSLVWLMLALGLTLALGVSIGSSGYTVFDLLDAGESSTDAAREGRETLDAAETGGRAVAATMILRLRLPRLLLAAIAGAALGASGAVFQAILRNPLADPYVLGVSGGAALGAFAATAAGLTTILPIVPVRELAAFVGAILTVGFIFALSRVGGRVASYPMILIGVVTNTI
jgi:hypothetical protein